MICRTCLGIALTVSPPALAQRGGEDELAPLAPSPGKRRSPAAKKAARKGAARDPLSPLARTQLVVKLPAGTQGAFLFIDDREIGALPRPRVELSPGEHWVVVKRPGYADFARTVSVRVGQTLELPVAFELSTGTLSISVEPEGAQVFIDGRSVGTAPVSGLVLSPGAYQVRVVREGFAERTTSASVRPGLDEAVTVRLLPLMPPMPTPRAAAAGLPPAVLDDQVKTSRPWHSRWYVWTAIGAAVAGGVVTSVLLARPGKQGPDEVLGAPADGTLNYLAR